jgi:predicted transcriptional regulator of viral defense system
MPQNIETKILSRIKKAGKGMLFFAENFVTYGNADAVRKALERLVRAGNLERIAFGIYVRAEMDTVIGKVTSGIDEIAKAIARRDRARIVPTGMYALNRLGLSTQVPMNVVYLTDGAARKIKIDKGTITFKKTTPKNVTAIGEISSLVIQALRTIGKTKVTTDEIKQIRQLLGQEKKTRLAHDFRLAPAWIREIMKPVLQEADNE